MSAVAAHVKARKPAPSADASVNLSARQCAGVQSILASRVVQPKLEIGKPDDRYEREADQIADSITSEPAVDSSAGSSPPPMAHNVSVVQRRCLECGDADCQCEEEVESQEDNEELEHDGLVQANGMKTWQSAIEGAVESGIRGAATGGQAIPNAEFFGARLGHDFSNARVHNDSTANRLAASIGARAFTYGDHVFFAAGEYAPESDRGRHLLAHELVHVVQQTPWVARNPGDNCTTDRREGQGAFTRGQEQYHIWGTWRGNESVAAWSRRVFAEWIVWRFGPNTDTAVRARFIREFDTSPFQSTGITPTQNCQYIFSVPLEFIRRATRALQPAQRDDNTQDDTETVDADNHQVGERTETNTDEQIPPGEAPQPQEEPTGEEENREGDPEGEREEGPPVPVSEDTFLGGETEYTNITEFRRAFPADIRGAEIQPPGSLGAYRMRLDYAIAGPDLLSQVVEAMNWINYRWEIYNVTSLVRGGLRATVETEHRHIAESEETTVTDADVAGRRAEQRVEDIAEDAESAIEGIANPIEAANGNGAGTVAVRLWANQVSLELLPLQAIFSAGGWLVDSLADIFGGREQEREIPFPSERGFYLVRCIAQPTPQGEDDDILRLPSVATKLVQVEPPDVMASQSLDQASTRAAERELELEAALQRRPPDQDEISRLRQEIRDLGVQGSGNPIAVIDIAIRKKTEEIGEAPEFRKAGLRRELAQLQETRQFMVDRAGELTGTSHRLEASLISDDTGQQYTLLLQIGRLSASHGRHRYRISDVTTRDGETYEGGGASESEAAWNAAREFAGHSPYGRGSLAFRFPERLEVTPRQDVLRSTPEDTALARARLEELATALTVAALAVPGAGQVAAVLGAALAAERLLRRWSQGTLRFDESAITDAISLLGAAASGARLIGQAQLVRAGDSFVLASATGDAAAISRTIRTVNTLRGLGRAAEFLENVSNHGGFIWGNLVTLNAVMKLNGREARGEITSMQARRERAHLLVGALRDGALQFLPPAGSHDSQPRRDADAPEQHRPPTETQHPIIGDDAPTVHQDPAATADTPTDVVEPTTSRQAPVDLPAGVQGNEHVRAVARSPDGLHSLSILRNGQIIRCSLSCGQLRFHYQEFLNLAPDHPLHAESVRLANELADIETRASDPTADAEEVAALAGSLEMAMRRHASEPLSNEIGNGMSSLAVRTLLGAFTATDLRAMSQEFGAGTLNSIGGGGAELTRMFAHALEAAAHQPDPAAARAAVVQAANRGDTVTERQSSLNDTVTGFEVALPTPADAATPADVPDVADTAALPTPADANLTAGQRAARERARERVEGLRSDRQGSIDIIAERQHWVDERNSAVSERNRLVAEMNAASDPDVSSALREQARAARDRMLAAEAELEAFASAAIYHEDLQTTEARLRQQEVIAFPDEHRAALPCFSAGTQVHTPGGMVPIESLRAGDEVYACAPESGRVTAQPVLQLHHNRTDHFYRLGIAGLTIRITAQHPVWLSRACQWLPAKQVTAGMYILAPNGNEQAVESVDYEATAREEPSYNLSVANDHTYFVGNGMLVHNEAVDLGLGGQHVIYICTNADTRFEGFVYVGQTNDEGKREGDHRRLNQAAYELLQARVDAGETLTPHEQAQLRFHDFMRNATLEVIIRGIDNTDQASFLEQRNIDIERTSRGQTDDGQDFVMNRREQLVSSLPEVTDRIVADPAVRAAGYCIN